MMQRRRRFIRAKQNRSYTVEQLARLFGCHKNTIRNWFRAGLQPIDDRRPMLFSGHDVNAFHAEQRATMKRPCAPGELYCLPCRKAQWPAGDMAEFVESGKGRGRMRAICPDCGRLLFQAVSSARLAEFQALLDVTDAKA
ncbi:helix-turn-helix domain-containing protein [Mesorhizobium sp. M0871]|uniref:helix-turn-helix domain-containing protein n=1 Tax=Mesorhizobium sp. M0871 TaxID=2957017 RepID=UPI00333C2CBE